MWMIGSLAFHVSFCLDRLIMWRSFRSILACFWFFFLIVACLVSFIRQFHVTTLCSRAHVAKSTLSQDKLSTRSCVKIRAVQLFTENRFCVPSYELYVQNLIIILGWLKLPNCKKRAGIKLDFELTTHWMGGEDITSSPPFLMFIAHLSRVEILPLHLYCCLPHQVWQTVVENWCHL